MAERMVRVGQGGFENDPRGPLHEPGPSGGIAVVRRLMGPFLIAIGALVLYGAWWIIWEHGHPAASAIRRLESEDAAGRMEALEELGSLGPHDPELAVPALMEALRDHDPTNRSKAAEDLGVAIMGHWTTGPGPDQVREAIFALMRLFGDPDVSVRDHASHALTSVVDAWHGSPGAMGFGSVQEELTRMSSEPDPGMRAAALQALAAIALRTHEPPPNRLIEALNDPSENVRTAAARGLLLFENAVIAMLPNLIRAMAAAQPECRPAYFEVLDRQRVAYPPNWPPESLSALLAALDVPDPWLRGHVALLLGDFRDGARAAIPRLLAILRDPGPPVPDGSRPEDFRRARRSYQDPALVVARSIREIAGRTERNPIPPPIADPPIAEALIRLAASPSSFRRLAAVEAMEGFAAVEPIVGALLAATRDPNALVRAEGLRALRSREALTPPRFLSLIGPALDDPSPTVRAAAAQAIQGFGAGIEPLVPALLRRGQDDPDPGVRDACATALGRIRPGDLSTTVIPAFTAAIDRSGTPAALREHLIEALTRFGSKAAPAVPAIARTLISAEREPDRPSPKETEPLSLEATYRPTPAEERILLRRNAAQALGALAPGTPAADEAISALIAALDDPIDEIERVVAQSLTAFGASARRAVPALASAFQRARSEKHLLRAGLLADSIGRIDPTSAEAAVAVAFLSAVLYTEDGPARVFAERALANFGPAAAPAIPALMDLIRRPDLRSGPELASVARALGRIAPGGPDAGLAVAAIVEALISDPPPPFAAPAIESLTRFGAEAVPALPRLRELENSNEPEVRSAAHKAVAAIAGRAG